jgi:hypothetical protein
MGDDTGTINSSVIVPTENRIDKPESAPSEEVRTMGAITPTFNYSSKKQIEDGRRKDARNLSSPPSPPTKKR